MRGEGMGSRRIGRSLVLGMATLGLLVLSACGGGNHADSVQGDGTRAEYRAEASDTTTLLARAGQINAAELAAAQRQASQSPRPAPQMVNKAAARTVVYRFYNTQTAAHFYTISETERDNVRNTLPQFSYEGPAFYVSPVADTGLSPVYRFFNTQTGVHFYTISGDEKDHILQTLPQFSFEGIAYYASMVAGDGLTPLYRFFVPSKGFHFYTISRKERDNVNMFLRNAYQFEGGAYYVVGEADSFETSMLNEVNAVRSAGGFGTLNHNTYLDAAARNHANYMMLNYRDGWDWGGVMDQVDPATGWLTAHTERVGTPGFTGVLPEDRAVAAGYDTNYVAEVISPGYSFLEGYPYQGCVDVLFSTVFHRNGLLYYGLEEFGSAVLPSQDGILYACILEPALNPANNRYPPVGWVGVYPLPDQQNLATAMGDGSGEAPDPLPSVPGIEGNPVSIYIRPYDVLTVNSFELRDSSGALVVASLLTEAEFPFYLTSGMAHLVPHAPLRSNTRYTAQFSGLNNGLPLTRVWSFTTR